MNLHVSMNNSKVPLPCIDLPACVTCRPDAPCFKLCYAQKGRFKFANVREPRMRNLNLWHTNHLQYEAEAVEAIRNYRYARFHASGDIPDPQYMEMLVRVANTCPETHILVFTKRWSFVNDWIREHGELPGNLRIVLSAWGDAFLPDNPYHLPVAYVRLKNEPCTIPEDAIECTGYCGECVKGHSCWSLMSGESVVFNQH